MAGGCGTREMRQRMRQEGQEWPGHERPFCLSESLDFIWKISSILI
jgi:hypothetical protein